MKEYVNEPDEWKQQSDINLVKQMMSILAVDLESRCNYWASLEGLLISKFIVDYIYLGYHKERDTAIRFKTNLEWIVFIVFSFFFSFLDGLAYLTMLMSRLVAHQDMFNFGVVAGKVLVSVAFWYFNGFFLYENILD